MTEKHPALDVLGLLPTLRRYARSLARNDADAEDLVHDALVRAYERRDRFAPSRGLRPWLISILHNLFVDRSRAHNAERRRTEQMRALAEDATPAHQELSVRLTQVRDAFLGLPEEQRAALHLVSIEGLSYQEAAAALDIPIGTLMSRLGRARAALRALEDGPTAGPRLRIVRGGHDTTG